MASIKDSMASILPDLKPYEELYKHFHLHPELSFQEHETAAKIYAHLKSLGIDGEGELHKGIGGTGVVGVVKNGPGPVVLLRADIDALPVEEKTGLEYKSIKRMNNRDGEDKPIMHACGHDMHITSLLAAAEALVKGKDRWSGTLILLFQPAEELGAGAQAMVDDGLYLKVPVPDVVFGGHVMPFRAGTVGTRRGLMASAADSFALTVHGRGGHGSQPHRSVDPIVLAAHTITRLQTIPSREVDPQDAVVITVGAIHGGSAENVISDHCDMKLNVRTFNAATRTRVLQSMRRIIDAESTASNAPKPPELVPTTNFPFLANDEDATKKVEEGFSAYFGDAYDANVLRLGGSEDCGILANAIKRPCVFWTYGGADRELFDIAEAEGRLLEDVPFNHSPFFAPVIQPTLKVAVEAYVVSVLTWSGKDGGKH